MRRVAPRPRVAAPPFVGLFVVALRRRSAARTGVLFRAFVVFRDGRSAGRLGPRSFFRYRRYDVTARPAGKMTDLMLIFNFSYDFFSN